MVKAEVDDDDAIEEEVTVERLIAEYGADNLEFVVEGNGEQQAVSLGEVRERASSSEPYLWKRKTNESNKNVLELW